MFVRNGRSIEPTSAALTLAPKIETVLESYRDLMCDKEFDPLTHKMEFTISGNDFPIRFIFPELLKDLDAQGVDISLRFVYAGIPVGQENKRVKYQRFVIAPFILDNLEFDKRALVSAKMSVFYDPEFRDALKTREEVLKAPYCAVRFSDSEASLMAFDDLKLDEMNVDVTVPNFSYIPDFVKGTNRIAVELGFMKKGLLEDLAVADLPFDTAEKSLYLAWHRSENKDPAHVWFRNAVIAKARALVGPEFSGIDPS